MGDPCRVLAEEKKAAQRTLIVDGPPPFRLPKAPVRAE